MSGEPIDVPATFGGLDIYLFDQLQRGRIRRSDTILDAGCGFGRNLVYLLRSGYDVYAADADADAMAEVRTMAATLAPTLPPDHFRVEPLESLSFPDGLATVVISSAVLHFARDDAEFEAMLRGTWRVLASGGMFFCRLASSIGMEGRTHAIDGRRHRLLDGTTRYLVDEPLLMEWTARLGGRLLDPIKTTVVQDQRAMTTWVVRKN
jgi:tellurite methyltransferase